MNKILMLILPNVTKTICSCKPLHKSFCSNYKTYLHQNCFNRINAISIKNKIDAQSFLINPIY